MKYCARVVLPYMSCMHIHLHTCIKKHTAYATLDWFLISSCCSETQSVLQSPQATVPSNGMQQMVGTNPNPMVWNNQRIHPYTGGISMKSLKKTKVVQSAWCELCKVDCNSHEMLNTHKMGKKHKKNMKKLEESKNVVNVAAEHAATEVTKDQNPLLQR